MSHGLFTADYQSRAYWLDALETEPSARTSTDSADFPRSDKVDVVIVGSGYTGLHAALTLARAGREVVIFEAGEIGHGCSRRNGGQVSSALKPDFTTLSHRYGGEMARALLQEGVDSVDWLETFLQQENIDCQFERCGSFHGAHSARQFQRLKTALKADEAVLPTGAWLVDPVELPDEIGTSAYFGGAVYPREGSLHPARYHKALLTSVLREGVSVYARCPVSRVEPLGSKATDCVRVETARGPLLAREVVVATNGYTGSATPWLRRRIIPIGSYMIATEPLPRGLMDQILPTNRMIHDTRKVVYYFRPSPDRQRVIFGGRVSAGEVTPEVSGPLLHRALCDLFPQLAEVRISHSWMGKVGFSFDDLAHTGSHRHVHYALGYCGSGIAMSSFLGMQVGNTITGAQAAYGPRPTLPFNSRWYYRGNPWFLGSAIQYYRFCDRFS